MIVENIKPLEHYTRASEETLKGLLQWKCPKVFNHYDKLWEVDFYSDLYQITYNRSEPKVDVVIEYLSKHKDGPKLIIGEAFSGSANGLIKVKETFPQFDYFAIDNTQEYFSAEKNLEFKCIDLMNPTKVSLEHKGLFDVIFVDGTNSSQCLLTDVKKWLLHIATIKELLKPGGVIITSYIPTSSEISEGISLEPIEDRYELDSGEYKNPNLKHRWVEWYQVSDCSHSVGTQTYYDFALVFETKDSTEPIYGYKCAKGYTVGFIPAYVVKSLFEGYGFETVEFNGDGLDTYKLCKD
jgi:hypothetical protein